jgi:hypothetical protein
MHVNACTSSVDTFFQLEATACLAVDGLGGVLLMSLVDNWLPERQWERQGWRGRCGPWEGVGAVCARVCVCVCVWGGGASAAPACARIILSFDSSVLLEELQYSMLQPFQAGHLCRMHFGTLVHGPHRATQCLQQADHKMWCPTCPPPSRKFGRITLYVSL